MSQLLTHRWWGFYADLERRWEENPFVGRYFTEFPV
jgi:hypothetical protein